MSLVAWLAALAVGLCAAVIGLYLLARWLQTKEPYGSFVRLRTRQKVAFFRELVRDRRVPVIVKVLPFLLVLYLLMPFDLIPDFLPVLGYVDDIAIALAVLALVVRLTPPDVIKGLLGRVTSGDRSSS